MANNKFAGASVRVTGVASTIQKLRSYGTGVEREVNRVIEKYAKKIERSAKRNAPVDTGRLRASIRHRLESMAAEVFTDVDYAAFQEFGTGRRGRASGVETPDDYDYGNVAGVAAQPYLRPAVDEHRSAFVRELRGIHQRAQSRSL